MKIIIGRRGVLLLAIASTLFAGGGIAYATIPDAGSGVYHACMLNGLGTIRVIDPSLPAKNLLGHCTSRETEIKWNEQGVKGATGPQGPQGIQGPPGQGTTYAPTTGLELTEIPPPFEAHLFGIKEGYRLPQNCAGGAVPVKQNSGSGWGCSSGSGGSGGLSHAYSAFGSDSALGGDDEVVSLTVPAGSYVISGKAEVFNKDGSAQTANCKLSTGDETQVRIAGAGINEGADRQAIPVQDVATFPEETTIVMTCATYDGTASARLTAIAVAGIN